MIAGRPVLELSAKAYSQPASLYFLRQRITDGRLSPTMSAICVCVTPSAAKSKILARCTRLASSVRVLAIFSKAIRSSSDKLIGSAFLMDTTSVIGMHPL